MGWGDCYLAGVRSHFARENNVCPARTSGALNGVAVRRRSARVKLPGLSGFQVGDSVK